MLVVIHLLLHIVCKYNKKSPKRQIFQVKILFFLTTNQIKTRDRLKNKRKIISLNHENKTNKHKIYLYCKKQSLAAAKRQGIV